MNQDLQNYINEARSAGKPDEVIKQELRSAGWAEQDITQTFSGSAAPVVATAATTSTLTIAAVAILVLFLLGVSGYLVFAKKDNNPESLSQTSTDSNNTTSQQNTGANSNTSADNSAFPFTCRDVLSENDFQRVSAAKGQVTVEGEAGATEFSQLPTLQCNYLAEDQLFTLNINGVGSKYTAKQMLDVFVTTSLGSEAAGEGKRYIDLAGVGTRAVWADGFSIGGVYLADSTNKYYVTIGGFPLNTFPKTQALGVQAAKIIDANLSKY